MSSLLWLHRPKIRGYTAISGYYDFVDYSRASNPAIKTAIVVITCCDSSKCHRVLYRNISMQSASYSPRLWAKLPQLFSLLLAHFKTLQNRSNTCYMCHNDLDKYDAPVCGWACLRLAKFLILSEHAESCSSRLDVCGMCPSVLECWSYPKTFWQVHGTDFDTGWLYLHYESKFV